MKVEGIKNNASVGMLGLLCNSHGLLQLVDISEESQELHCWRHPAFLA